MPTAMNLQGPCPTCGHLGKSLENKMLRQASDAIGKFLDQTYFDQIPLAQIDSILEGHGFNSNGQLCGLLVGREGRLHVQVGLNTWLAMSWYRMVSGRYEVVGYLG
jgi:hypothetical protein